MRIFTLSVFDKVKESSIDFSEFRWRRTCQNFIQHAIVASLIYGGP